MPRAEPNASTAATPASKQHDVCRQTRHEAGRQLPGRQGAESWVRALTGTLLEFDLLKRGIGMPFLTGTFDDRKR